MKSMILIILGLAFSLNSYSQDKLLTIERGVNEYYADTLYNQIDLHYLNSSDSVLVLWIEKEYVDSLSNSQKIKNHFFTRKGDSSLMQMIWDGNVECFVPGLFDNFMKIIKPKDRFTVSILKTGKVNSELIRSIEKHIVIVKANDIKGLQIDDSINMFNYKGNNVILLTEWMK
ncbi:hypothetical protein BY457_1076 [Marinilabilia salmonicolor]|uniref:hypothetical protein n=1 Tax=Marinilabilia salmonicolor TaxID=989 RepID=UPI000D07EA51|nr:hypothetical protein [Marinilabilia salmonicolor]PRY99936.1 hypothetical protein BY457_1076 [Marinilabilia salmonicolor]